VVQTPSPLCHAFYPYQQFLLNLVERFFAELTEEVVREGSFKSVPELLGVIEDYRAFHPHSKNAWPHNALLLLR